MHRLPELLIASIALLVLAGLLVLFWRGDAGHFNDSNPDVTRAVATIAPLQLPALSFALPRPANRGDLAVQTAPGKQSPPAGKPIRIAVVVDDCGISETQTKAAIHLPTAFTLSFLPYGRHSAALARQAQAEGHEILLHMPMQPIGSADPGPEALVIGLSAAEVTKRVQRAFAIVPMAVGLNNHMGSRFTADAAALAPVMHVIRQQGGFFLDSMTSNRSVGATVARASGIPALARDVFLDDVVTEAEVTRQLERLEAIARKNGRAIAIGHPHPSTLRVLQRWAQTLPARGFQLVAVSQLL